MATDNLFGDLQRFFDQAARDKFRLGAESWEKLKKHESWDHWLNIGEAVSLAQAEAQRVTNASSGRRFNAFMASCYADADYLGALVEVDKSDRSWAVKCWHDRKEINTWRDTLGLAQALRLNHPKVVYQKWQRREHKRRPPPPPKAGNKGTVSVPRRLLRRLAKLVHGDTRRAMTDAHWEALIREVNDLLNASK